MNQSQRSLSFFVLPLLVLFALSISVTAQSESGPLTEPTYEVALHVVIGSDEKVPGAALPASLSNISRHLRNNFSFANYRLANTFLGRLSNTGNIEYKSVSNILGQETEPESQTFLEWSLGNLRSVPSGFHARTFRFGARVPVRTGTYKDDSGKMSPSIVYEPVGLTVNTIGFPSNTPTLVGTISLPKTTGTIFLVATIRPVDR